MCMSFLLDKSRWIKTIGEFFIGIGLRPPRIQKKLLLVNVNVRSLRNKIAVFEDYIVRNIISFSDTLKCCKSSNYFCCPPV